MYEDAIKFVAGVIGVVCIVCATAWCTSKEYEYKAKQAELGNCEQNRWSYGKCK